MTAPLSTPGQLVLHRMFVGATPVFIRTGRWSGTARCGSALPAGHVTPTHANMGQRVEPGGAGGGRISRRSGVSAGRRGADWTDERRLAEPARVLAHEEHSDEGRRRTEAPSAVNREALWYG